jgi:hypothetical protein
VEPKTEAVPPSSAPSIHTSTFIGLGPACVPDQAPFVSGLNPFCHSHLSGKRTPPYNMPLFVSLTFPPDTSQYHNIQCYNLQQLIRWQ